jgi:predicted esterase
MATGTRRRVGLGLVAAVVAASLGMIGPLPGARAEGVRYRDLVFDDYTVTPDLVYGSSPNYQGVVQQHELDVLQPADDPQTTGRAAVVWVHGGFFKRGSKDIEWYTTAREQFVQAGYVVFSINYRLNESLPEGLLPTLETLRLEEYIKEAKDAAHDAQAAVRWVRANAAAYGVDPDLIAIAGHSAGGIISQMVGFNEHDPGTSGTPGVSSRVAAVVSSAGGSLPVVLADVGLGEPPMLLSHGVADQVVPYPADLPACVVTVALGNVCEQQLDPDQEHGQFGYDGWREFLYRRMIDPPPLDLPVQVRLVGLESLGG